MPDAEGLHLARAPRVRPSLAGTALHGRPLPPALRRRMEELVTTAPGGRPEAVRRPLAAGTVLQPLVVHEARLQSLLRDVVTEVGDRVVWVDGPGEVVVDLAKLRTGVRAGLVVIGVPLRNDTVSGELSVPFAVGTPKRPVGMAAAAPRAPRGPEALAVPWGDAVTALAWGALIDVATELAALLGEDEHGEPLRPAALIAEDGQLGIVAQATPDLPDAPSDDERPPRGDERPRPPTGRPQPPQPPTGPAQPRQPGRPPPPTDRSQPPSRPQPPFPGRSPGDGSTPPRRP